MQVGMRSETGCSHLESCEVRSGDRTAGARPETGEMASCATARAPNVDSSMSDAIF